MKHNIFKSLFRIGKRHKTKQVIVDQNNTIIVRVDGGICSQLAFYAYGKYLSDRGYNVKYDLSWFDKCGKDTDGKFVRNFDMKKGFPKLAVNIATDEEINLYKKKYNQSGKSIDNITAPAYIGGYPAERETLFHKQISSFISAFQPTDKELVTNIITEIQETESCAVHIRRGDLGKYDPAYGWPTPVEYFINAVALMRCINKNTVFFFFSDEPDWIRENIIPQLNKNIKYRIVDKNGSDKGYLDLYLISRCKNIISSQGSLGTFGYLLSEKNGYLIMSVCRKYFLDNFNDVILLGYEKQPEPVKTKKHHRNLWQRIFKNR